MFEKEEKKLAELKNKYEDASIPVEALNTAIMAGFQKAKQKRNTPIKKWMFASTAAIIFLSGFFTTIRISPAFASYIAAIPGMDRIVEMIVHDKGMLAAISNEYYQEIGVSEEKNGVKLTIDGAIADENGMVLFYTLKPEKKYESMWIDLVDLKSLDGKEIKEPSTSHGAPHTPEKSSSFQGMIEYYFSEPLEAGNFQVSVTVKASGYTEDFTMPFTIKEIKSVKNLTINKDVTIQDQKVTFVKADIYPLRVGIHVKMDPNNTKKLLNFDDLRLVDEHGDVWSKITNGITGTRISDDEEIVYLQSNYFNEPMELYIALNKIQAIDKDEAELVVDIEKEEIIKQPKGNQIVSKVNVSGNDLIFTMRTKEEFSYFMFSTPKDRDGKELESGSSFSRYSDGDDQVYEHGINITDLHSVKGPISLGISYYPTWIVGSEKIKIK
ncbi:DUF4179 domain-containing protein [Lederbergia citri]|uniref:DUF4179 domain-containing protein n=1 Tax=Lederbergia citri TaxID=2833580 RepID=A0A942TGC5_9BACI|nr:DUF4179 domain-containing protein [Lederbergia citri]MBS4195864.1 DUF4179 domain-containing protein [Lederbergia citri]